MSVIETHIGGRRAAAREAAETRKKILLAGLAVVLLAVLAFELPKIMKRSSSPSSTASTSVVTTANPAVPVVGGSTQLTAAEAKRLRVIRQLDAKDPFVPLIHESTSTSSSSPASTPAPTQPSFRFTPSAAASAAASKPGVTKPVHVKPAAPSAAVIWTNGHRQVIGLGQTFKIGDVAFRLVAVTRKAVRLEIVGGAFESGKQAIRVRKGHPLKLGNTATGVQYRLLFARGTTEAPTATQPATQPNAQVQPSSTQPSDSSSSTESTNANAAPGS
jgi:hypothetical protein